MELADLEGIGPARLQALRAVGIVSLRDLLYMLPVRYEDRMTVYPCKTDQPGLILVQGSFAEPLKSSYFHGLSRVTGSIRDKSGKLSVCWFNEPWMASRIPAGTEVRLYGRLNVKEGRRTLQNPVVVEEPGWYPVYRSVKGLPSGFLRKLIRAALENVDDCCPETLPSGFRLRHRLCELNFAIRQAHFPTDPENLRIARRRLSFEQLLIYLVYVSMAGSHRDPADAFSFPPDTAGRFWEGMPFKPTGAQERVLLEIAGDLQKDRAMARLVQGDVGCGKTALAFGAIYLAAASGFQASMMAPTEILARQHYENAKKLLEPSGITCRLLTGSTRSKERRAILEELRSGACRAVFGTHALISADVAWQRLGLVITDEQHRFGVNQRSRLREKGLGEDGKSPHVLVMSATPIPRTLALILYGDLDLSLVDELPAGRIPVRTRLVPEEKRADMYAFLRREVARGRQAYVVCPTVEESESRDQVKSAKAVFADLKENALKDLRVALTWGDQKPDEKAAVIDGFVRGDYDVLVATTVIEVGVNNPNATLMIIENAERFGLSQLHQLRGRVGRGTEESWCFLLSDATEKLRILCGTNDGFAVSQRDLELRGPGDLLGTRQSGEALGPAMPGADVRLLDEAADTVRELRRNPDEKQTLRALEEAAVSFFEDEGRGIALS
ncbi:MAG: ATP-dependent DNA helicase RecG [Clostridiales bacterium]|nr:ATP-dependent DNA helicase RecG [Clostridiales bacterium]